MYKAVTDGEADVISAFSSDGRIAADDLVVLTDPQGRDPALRRGDPDRAETGGRPAADRAR